MSDLPLSGRIALVTGASRGIGYASALALAQAGAHVVAVARTQGGLQELDDQIRSLTGEGATLVPMDLTDGAGVDQLGLALHERYGRLDILVHSAAVLGLMTPAAHAEPTLWDKVFATNTTASFRLIRSMDPLLRQAEAGRAIFLTSGMARRARAFSSPYAASKAAMEMLVRVWAEEVEHTKVRAALLNPGPMRTRLRAEVMPGEDPMGLPPPSEIGPLVVELASSRDLPPPTATVDFAAWKAARRVSA